MDTEKRKGLFYTWENSFKKNLNYKYRINVPIFAMAILLLMLFWLWYSQLPCVINDDICSYVETDSDVKRSVYSQGITKFSDESLLLTQEIVCANARMQSSVDEKNTSLDKNNSESNFFFDAGDYWHNGSQKRQLLRVKDAFILYNKKINEAQNVAEEPYIEKLKDELDGFKVSKFANNTILICPDSESVSFLKHTNQFETLSQLRLQLADQRVDPLFIDPDSKLSVLIGTDVIVCLQNESEKDDFFKKYPLQHYQLKSLNTQFVLTLNSSNAEQILNLCTDIAKDHRVKWVEPDFISEIRLSYSPNDPLIFAQDYLGLDTQNLSVVWEDYKGDNVTIAVLDTGVQSAHPDLSSNVLSGWDFLYDNADANPDHVEIKDNGHGTCVAGVAAAVGNNAIGVIGVAAKAKILPIKLMTRHSETTESEFVWDLLENLIDWDWPSNSKIRDAIIYAADNGADILNFSWHITESSVVSDAINYASQNGRNGKGCIIFAAAGNKGTGSIGFPANHESVIAVGGLDIDRNKSRFVNSSYGDGLDIMGPFCVITTDLLGDDGFNLWSDDTPLFTRDDTFNAGTSFSSPYAAGIAALMLSKNPYLTSFAVTDIMRKSCDKVGGVAYEGGAFGAGGWNTEYGYGKINPLTAVNNCLAVFSLYVESNLSQASITVSPSDLDNKNAGIAPFNCKYLQGQVITLTARSSVDGRAFTEWQKDGVTYSTANSLTLTISEAMTMRAVYDVLDTDIYVAGSTAPDTVVTSGGPGNLWNFYIPVYNRKTTPVTVNVLKSGNAESWVTLTDGGSFVLAGNELKKYQVSIYAPSDTISDLYYVSISFNGIEQAFSITVTASGPAWIQQMQESSVNINGNWTWDTSKEFANCYDTYDISAVFQEGNDYYWPFFALFGDQALNVEWFRFFLLVEKLEASDAQNLNINLNNQYITQLRSSGFPVGIASYMIDSSKWQYLVDDANNWLQFKLSSWTTGDATVRWRVYKPTTFYMCRTTSAWKSGGTDIPLVQWNDIQDGFLAYARVYAHVDSVARAGNLKLYHNGDLVGSEYVSSGGDDIYWSIAKADLERYGNVFVIKGQTTDANNAPIAESGVGTVATLSDIRLMLKFNSVTPNLTLTKVVAPSQIVMGQQATVKISIFNPTEYSTTGDSTDLTDAALPAGVALVSGSLSDSSFAERLKEGHTKEHTYVISASNVGLHTLGRAKFEYRTITGDDLVVESDPVVFEVRGGGITVTPTFTERSIGSGTLIDFTATVTAAIGGGSLENATVLGRVYKQEGEEWVLVGESSALGYDISTQEFCGSSSLITGPGSYKAVVTAQAPFYDDGVSAEHVFTLQDVYFDANGGSVEPILKTVYKDRPYGSLPIPTKLGQTFVGWFTWSADGVSGVRVTAETVMTRTAPHTLYAYWTPAGVWAVFFDAQGGSVNPKWKAVAAGKAYGELPVPLRSGYTFVGWHTGSEDGRSGARVTAATVMNLNAAHTLYAYWTPAGTQAVHFDAQGGSVTPTWKSVADGKPYGSLPTPTRAGHNFIGWFTWSADGQSGLRVTAATIMTRTTAHTLYAYWTTSSLWVCFDAQGGSASPAWKPVLAGKPYGALPVPARSGYNFVGWFTWTADGQSGLRVTDATIMTRTAAHTLYAYWTPAGTQAVTFDAQGGSVSPAWKSVAESKPYGELPVPTRTGYTFAGWHVWSADGRSGGLVTAATVMNRTTAHALYAYWVAVGTQAVTFDAQGGAVSPTWKSVANGKSYGELPLPTRTGYTFAGWHTWSADGRSGGLVTAATVMTRTTGHALYAYWVAVGTQAVTFDAQGGAVSPTWKSVANGKPYGELPLPTRTSYTFAGWHVWSADGRSGGLVTAATVMTRTTAHALYAYWVAVGTQAVTFDAQGGAVNPTWKSVADGKPYGELPVPTRTGYTFVGWHVWSADGRSGARVTAATVMTRTTGHALYAYWVAVGTQAVTFDAQGGAVSPTWKSVANGKPYGELPLPTRTSYTFAGWHVWSADGRSGGLVTAATVMTRTTAHALYAYWVAVGTQAVTFDAQGGAVSPIWKTVAEGKPYGSLPAPTRAGHNFVGWFTWSADGQSGVRVTAATVMTRTTAHTLYAYWTPAGNQAVTFDAQGGAVSPTWKSVANGKPYGELPLPTRTGYTFVGWHVWSADGRSGGRVTAATVMTRTTAHALYAYWVAVGNQAVTFDAQGGAVSPTWKTVANGKPYGELPLPTRTGYTFAGWHGWSADGRSGGLVTAATVMNRTTAHTLYAYWTYVGLFSSIKDSSDGALSHVEFPKSDTAHHGEDDVVRDGTDDSTIHQEVPDSDEEYDGYIFYESAAGAMVQGTLTLRVAAAAGGHSATARLHTGEIVFRATSWAAEDADGVTCATLTAEDGRMLEVNLADGSFWGSLGDAGGGWTFGVAGCLNRLGDSEDQEAELLLASLAGRRYPLPLAPSADAQDGDALVRLEISIGDDANVAISGALADDRSFAGTARLILEDGPGEWAFLPFVAPLESGGGSLMGALWVDVATGELVIDPMFELYLVERP